MKPTPTSGGAFPTTHWSVVLTAGADTEEHAWVALETLCRRYWYPVYRFVRRQGRPHHEAEDCTQEFFAHLLAGAGIGRARPERGRFRTFLLTALNHFLINEWHRAQAERRGGGQPALSLDLDRADERFAREPVDPGLDPDEAFDRGWALDLLDQATEFLRAEYQNSGRGTLFGTLEPFLWRMAPAGALTEAAHRLGLSKDSCSVALHRLRRRFGERLRAMVAETVPDNTEIDAEINYLISVVGTTRRNGD